MIFKQLLPNVYPPDTVYCPMLYTYGVWTADHIRTYSCHCISHREKQWSCSSHIT